MSSIVWMMIVWSFVGASNCAAWEYDLMELFLSVWLKNWEPLYSEIALGWCWLVYSFLWYTFVLRYEIGVYFH